MGASLVRGTEAAAKMGAGTALKAPGEILHCLIQPQGNGTKSLDAGAVDGGVQDGASPICLIQNSVRVVNQLSRESVRVMVCNMSSMLSSNLCSSPSYQMANFECHRYWCRLACRLWSGLVSWSKKKYHKKSGCDTIWLHRPPPCANFLNFLPAQFFHKTKTRARTLPFQIVCM